MNLIRNTHCYLNLLLNLFLFSLLFVVFWVAIIFKDSNSKTNFRFVCEDDNRTTHAHVII